MPFCGCTDLLRPLKQKSRSLTSQKRPESPSEPKKETQQAPRRWKPTDADAGRQMNLFPAYPPPPPEEIIADRAALRLHIKNWRYMPPDYQEGPDNPIYSLYRFYENVMLDNTIGFRNEIEYHWNRSDWPLAEIPDPKDPNPSRYATIAGLVGLLQNAFNGKREIGAVRDGRSMYTWEEFEVLKKAERHFEPLPTWVSKVPSLEKPLVIPYKDGEVLKSWDDRLAAPICKEKNILLAIPPISFV